MNSADCIAMLRAQIDNQKNAMKHFEDQLYSFAKKTEIDKMRLRQKDCALTHAIFQYARARSNRYNFKDFYETSDEFFHVRDVFPYEYFRDKCKEFKLPYVEIY